MATQLHTELKGMAGDNPAAYLSLDVLLSIAINNTIAAIESLKGKTIPVGQGLLSAMLVDASFSTNPLSSARLIKARHSHSNEINIALNAMLTVNVQTFIVGDGRPISSIVVRLSDLLMRGTYHNNVIAFQGLDFTPKTTPQREPGAERLLEAAGIDVVEAARVEGVLAYSTINVCIGLCLGELREFALSRLFPTFDFGAIARLEPLENGTKLGIIPSEMTLRRSAVCDCEKGPDISTSPGRVDKTIPANPVAGSELGKVKIGGPVPQGIDPMRDLGRRYQGTGAAGVYLSQAVIRVLLDGLTIAKPIEIPRKDTVIQIEPNGNVRFSNISLGLDTVRGGIEVRADVNIDVSASLWLNLGCGNRAPIGLAGLVTLRKATITIGFYPAVDSSGAVILKGVLLDADMGDYLFLLLDFVGGGLIAAGIVLGVLVDLVLSLIVSALLPDLLKKEIQKYLGSHEWLLLDIAKELKERYGVGIQFSAPFDVDGTSLLASIAWARD